MTYTAMKLDCPMQSSALERECQRFDTLDRKSTVIANSGKEVECVRTASSVCRRSTCKEPKVPSNKTQASSKTRLPTTRSRAQIWSSFKCVTAAGGLLAMVLACSGLILKCSATRGQQLDRLVQVRSSRSIEQQQQETGSKGASDNDQPIRSDQLDGNYLEMSPLDAEQEQILAMLRNYYNLNMTRSNEFAATKSNDNNNNNNQATQQTGDKIDSQTGGDKRPADGARGRILPHLPAPSNLSVLIISWYPPILKLSWNLDEFGEGAPGQKQQWQDIRGNHSDHNQSNLHRATTTIGENKGDALETNSTQPQPPALTLPRSNDNDDNQPAAAAAATTTATSNEQLADEARHGPGSTDFDLELALDEANAGGRHHSSGQYQTGAEMMLANQLRELKLRRYLVEKSLTCFQVTYNVVDSRFKVIEEFPPYLRSVLLERLLPATKYNLRVTAVYLNGRFRRVSQRVQFISPTDNESRRFKENTYRPIHSYPDEQQELKIGLSQVRCEELALVSIALLAWIGCICLFFKKWGKIRMLEPYQPAYREQLDVGVTVGGPSSTPPQMQLGSISTGAATPTIGDQPAVSPSNSSLQLNKQHQLLGIADQQVASSLPKGGAASPATVQSPELSSPVTPVGLGKRQSEINAYQVGEVGVGRRPIGPKGAQLTSRTSAASAQNHLNYLFQSKAQALAKASLMWPTLTASHHKPRAAPLVGVTEQFQAGQKFRQEQYRTKFNSSVTNATSDLETLRRLGECLAARRHLTRMTGVTSVATGTPLTMQLGKMPLERITTKHSSCDSSFAVADPHHKLLLTTSGHQNHHQHHNQFQQQQLTRTGSSRSGSTGVPQAAASSLDSAQHQHEDVFGKLTAELEERSLRGAGFSPQSSRISRQSRLGSQSVAQENVSGESQTAALATVSQHKEQTQRTASSASGSRSQLMMSRFVRRNPAVDYTNLSQRESLRTATQSLDQSMSESMAQIGARSAANGSHRPGGSSSGLRNQMLADSQQHLSSNKLRRLQFVSKIHQHHHLAQSVSTSTLMQHQQHHRHTFDSNSLSLDSREHQSHEQSSPNQSDEDEQRQVQPPRGQSKQGQLPGSKPSSLELNLRHQQQQQQHHPLIEHHILIEPPSPPNNKPMNLQMGSDTCGSAAETRDRGRQTSCNEKGVAISAEEQARAQSIPPACGLGSSDQSDRQLSDDSQNSAPELGSGAMTRLASASCDSRLAHLQQTSQPEICLDDSPLETDRQLEAGGERQVCEDASEQPAQPTPMTSGRQTRDLDAFQKLANSYRASTERRLSRLACAQSSGQLSSQASCWFCSSPDCGNGAQSSWAATSSGGELASSVQDQRNQPVSSGGGGGEQAANLSRSNQPPVGSFSMCATDEHFLKPETTSSAAGLVSSPSRSSLSVHAGQCSQQQQLQTLTLARQARRCSYCHSIECANQQACLAIHQIRALQLQQQQRVGHRTGHERVAGAMIGAVGGASLRDWPSPPPTVPARKDTIQVRAAELDYGDSGNEGGHRARVSSVFACSPYARSHRRDSFVMLRALSQKKSKSAEDIAYLSSLVLQIWQREPNPLLKNASQLQVARDSQEHNRHRHHYNQPVAAGARRKSSSNLQAQASGGSGGSGLAHGGSVGAAHRRRQSTGQGAEFVTGGLSDQQRHSLSHSKRKRPKSSMTVTTDHQ